MCFAHDKVASQDFTRPTSNPKDETAAASLVLSPVADADETLVVENPVKSGKPHGGDAISPLEESVLKEPLKVVRVDRQGNDPVVSICNLSVGLT